MQNFDISRSLEILERTPQVLENLLSGLSTEWVMTNEGPDTWSPFDIVGHLIHGEKTDWMTRLEIIMSDQRDKTFAPFDRFAQFENSKRKTLEQLLLEFSTLRKDNIRKLRDCNLGEEHYGQEGIHPAFGRVTLSQLLATWVVHDLNHINQITRVMAGQYASDVGPWEAYLKVLHI